MSTPARFFVASTLLLALLLLEPARASPLTSLERIVRRSGVAEEKVVVTEDCVQMRSTAGLLMYISPGRPDVCGIFIVGQSNQIVTIEFDDFEIDCESGGLLEIVDGWEINGQLFPSVEDHPVPVSERYRAYCGVDDGPPRHQLIVMSQNVAMLQFRVPRPRQYFRIRVGFHHNPAPCNVMWTRSDGEVTLSNHGLRHNCSSMFVYSELVKVVQLDVGQRTAPRVRSPSYQPQHHRHYAEACTPGGGDYVEVLGGPGLDTTHMKRFVAVCGLRDHKRVSNDDDASDGEIQVAYPYTAIRLVSSGWSYNTVTVQVRQLV